MCEDLSGSKIPNVTVLKWYEDAWTSLIINLTNRCNTHCRYCFQSARKTETDHLSRANVYRILSFFSTKTDKLKVVQLTGGESTLHPEFSEIVEDALSLGFAVRVQTNGLSFADMTDRALALYSSPRVFVKISVDGWDSHSHEYLRARGSFDNILRGLERLRMVSNNIAVKSVIHNRNHNDIHRMLDFCLEHGARGYGYNVLRFEGDASSLDTETPIKELDVVKRLIPYLNQPKYRHLLNGTRILRYFLSPTWQIPLPKSFYVDYDGCIFSDQCCNSEDCIGNACEGDLDKQFDVHKIKQLYFETDEETHAFVRENLKIKPIRSSLRTAA